MVNVAARLDLDRILEGLNPDFVDEKKPLPVEQSDFSEVLRQYRAFNEWKPTLEDMGPYNLLDATLKRTAKIKTILPPAAINALFSSIITNDYNADRMTFFISCLIQNSYNAGYNDFLLQTLDEETNYLCRNLQGTKDNPLKVTVTGNGTSHLGGESQYIFLTVHGDAWGLGPGVRDSTFILDGDDLGNLGWHPIDSMSSDGSLRSTYVLKGKIGSDAGRTCSDCTFKVYNQDAVKKLYIPPTIYNFPTNTIILVENGIEKVIVENGIEKVLVENGIEKVIKRG